MGLLRIFSMTSLWITKVGRWYIEFPSLHGPGIPVVRSLSLWICFMEMSWRIQIWVREVYVDFCTPSHVTPSIAALSVLKRKLVSEASTLLPLWHLFFHVTEQGDWPADAWGATEGHQRALHCKSHPGSTTVWDRAPFASVPSTGGRLASSLGSPWALLLCPLPERQQDYQGGR